MALEENMDMAELKQGLVQFKKGKVVTGDTKIRVIVQVSVGTPRLLLFYLY